MKLEQLYPKFQEIHCDRNDVESALWANILERNNDNNKQPVWKAKSIETLYGTTWRSTILELAGYHFASSFSHTHNIFF
jgi:hypothetical protein